MNGGSAGAARTMVQLQACSPANQISGLEHTSPSPSVKIFAHADARFLAMVFAMSVIIPPSLPVDDVP